MTKIRFNGMYSRTRSGGCPCHGGASSKVTFQTSRGFSLPSGRYITFHYGQVYEVSEEDAQFLLSYTQTDKDGLTFSVFVEDK